MAITDVNPFIYSHPLSPEDIIDTLFRDLAVWSDRPRWAGSGFTRLVIELADLPGHPARAIARRHKAMLEAHLAELFAKAKVDQPAERAREVWLLSEGAISLILTATGLSRWPTISDAWPGLSRE